MMHFWTRVPIDRRSGATLRPSLSREPPCLTIVCTSPWELGGACFLAYIGREPRTSRAHAGAERVVDRVYVADLPRLRKDLERLKDEFSKLDSPKTDWTRLRIEPLLKHLDTLEHLIRSPEFSQEIARLRMGAGMFHSDLIYLRENVKQLEKVLESESASK